MSAPLCEKKNARQIPAMLPNYFTGVEVAARYAQARPYFHAEVAQRVRTYAGVARFRHALDVGCGSGQSAVALAAVSDEVLAIDASQSMLEHATPLPNITYKLGCAEQLASGCGEFDLISAGLALHWFDQDRFYGECHRVLDASGVLAVYNDHFTTHMQDVPACTHWMRSAFAKRFPSPRRGMRDIDEAKAEECGFKVVQRESFSHVVQFSRAQFIAYLLTRSNTLDAIRSGRQDEAQASAWLEREISSILPDGVTGSFIFKCNLCLMRKRCGLPG